MTYCKGCLSKQQKINELEEEITSLKSKLHYQERTAKEGFFGSSTPSSKIPVKPNSPTGDKRNRGGAKPGHKGHGRSSIREQDADNVEKINIGNTCPDCGSILEDKGTKTRAVIDCQPVKMKKVVYYLERKRCPRCKKIISARPPGVLAKCLYSNQLLAYVAVQHYIYGNTLGQIEKQTGIGYNGEIKLLPALPKAWPTGYIKGLVARGAFEVDIDWKDGKLTKASVKSRVGNPCRIRYNIPLNVTSKGKAVKTRSIEKSVIEFDTKSGGVYVITK
jgi:hypothetical protein